MLLIIFLVLVAGLLIYFSFGIWAIKYPEGKLANFLLNWKNWWDHQAKPQIVRIDAPKEYMEGRLVYCANCEGNKVVWRYQGYLRCYTCNSRNWEIPVPIRPAFDKDIMKKVCAPSGPHNREGYVPKIKESV